MVVGWWEMVGGGEGMGLERDASIALDAAGEPGLYGFDQSGRSYPSSTPVVETPPRSSGIVR